MLILQTLLQVSSKDGGKKRRSHSYMTTPIFPDKRPFGVSRLMYLHPACNPLAGYNTLPDYCCITNLEELQLPCQIPCHGKL